jgi:hypothetical protein
MRSWLHVHMSLRILQCVNFLPVQDVSANELRACTPNCSRAHQML